MECIRGLWVDDQLPLPKEYGDIGWIAAVSYNDAILKLTQVNFDCLSLDHDIASYNEHGREMTGYDIALWLVERKMQGLNVPKYIWTHSANPVGAQRIRGVIDRYLSQ